MNSLSDFYKVHQGKLSAKWEGNLREYDRLLLPYKDRPVRTLEIGVQNGGSLDIFKEYFANGEKFIGCDINLDCGKLFYDDPRISLIIDDANTDEAQAKILSQSDAFDLIIDDGSHMPDDIVCSFARYFPYLKEGGLFIVEDLHCSYWQEFGGGLYHPFSSIAFFKYLVDIINHEHWNVNKSREDILASFSDRFSVEFPEDMLSQVSSVEFVNSMCVIHKSRASLVRLGEQIFSGQSELVVARASFTPPSQQGNNWSTLDLSPAESFERLSKSLAERDAQIAERDEELAERDEQLAAILNSRSWRLTKPLRIVQEKYKLNQWLANKWLGDLFLRLGAHFRGEISRGRKNALENIKFHIDRPIRILRIVKGSFLVTGWCVDLDSRSSSKVRIRIGKRVYQPCIVPRPEVPKVLAPICDVPKDVGFVCVPLVPMGLHSMRVDIQDSGDTWVPVHRALILNLPALSAGLRKVAARLQRTKKDQNELKTGLDFDQTIAVVYLVRGADKDWPLSCERFIDSYNRYPSGVKHSLYVIFKGFADNRDLEKAKALTASVSYKPVFLDDNSYDIGAYIEWANMIDEQFICVFNTASEILASDWLRKLALNLSKNDVGLVGASASYESLSKHFSEFPGFPNKHIRSTGFMIDREYFCVLTNGLEINEKIDALRFESGFKSLTRQVLSDGKKVLLVGRNGKGYAPYFWPTSGTFRQGKQENLLVADNQTRNFNDHSWEMKKFTILHTWGAEYVK